MKAEAVNPSAASAARHGAAAVPRATAARRVADIDAVKGAGISLVVLGHAFVGLMAARLVPADSWMAWTHHAIYLFHMPLFFLLSGLFVARRPADAPAAFLRWLGLGLLWPYLLWSVLQLAAIHVAGSAVNTPTELTPGRVVALLWQPASQYWFLHALAMFHVVAYVTGRLGWQRWWLPAALLLQAALLTAPFRATTLGSYWPYLVWFALGAALTGERAAAMLARLRDGLARPWAPWALPLSLAVLFALQAEDLRAYDVHYKSAATLGAQLAGIAMTVAACALAAPAVRDGLARLGRHSMAIFLVHVLVVAGSRIVLLKLAPGLPVEAVLAVITLLGVVVPVMVAELAQRAGLSTLLGFERAPRRAVMEPGR